MTPLQGLENNRVAVTLALVGMARCAVPARVQRAERMLDGVRIKVPVAPLNAARTAQRAIPIRKTRPSTPPRHQAPRRPVLAFSL